jgi:hypothetical protein
MLRDRDQSTPSPRRRHCKKTLRRTNQKIRLRNGGRAALQAMDETLVVVAVAVTTGGFSLAGTL